MYTGDLVRIKPKHVAQSFIDSQCQPIVQYTHNYKGSSTRGGTSKGTSRTVSSASSVKSENSSNASQKLSHQYEYLKAILTNVFTVCGYKHFIKYLKRTGKNKLIISKVIK